MRLVASLVAILIVPGGVQAMPSCITAAAERVCTPKGTEPGICGVVRLKGDSVLVLEISGEVPLAMEQARLFADSLMQSCREWIPSHEWRPLHSYPESPGDVETRDYISRTFGEIVGVNVLVNTGFSANSAKALVTIRSSDLAPKHVIPLSAI